MLPFARRARCSNFTMQQNDLCPKAKTECFAHGCKLFELAFVLLYHRTGRIARALGWFLRVCEVKKEKSPKHGLVFWIFYRSGDLPFFAVQRDRVLYRAGKHTFLVVISILLFGVNVKKNSAPEGAEKEIDEFFFACYLLKLNISFGNFFQHIFCKRLIPYDKYIPRFIKPEIKK